MLLREELRYHPDGYQHQYKYKHGSWDGFNHLYSIGEGRFRAGLLARVCRLFDDKGVKYAVEVAPHPDEELINLELTLGSITPFDYQQAASGAVMHEERGLIVSPTGSGKTLIIALALNVLRRRAFIVVTDVVLLDQMHQALSKYLNSEIGIIGDGDFEIRDITVTTIQSLTSILKAKSVKGADKRVSLVEAMAKTGVVFSDEAHLSDSDSFDAVMPQFSKTRRFYGLSATPYGWGEKSEKRQNLVLEQHFGDVIYDGRKLDFVEIGIKVPLYIDYHVLDYVNDRYEGHFKRGPGGIKSLDHGKNYRACLEAELLFNHDYQAKVAELAWNEMANGRSVFIHAGHSLEFGEAINKQIPGSVFVSGATTRKDRRAIYEAVRSKERLVMVSDIGGTGLDIPSLDAVLLASDLKDVRQLAGRVLRSDGKKKVGRVIDLAKDCQFLKKHATFRKYQYKDQGAILTIKE
jgi:superfamily II DNA or RNA helicase